MEVFIFLKLFQWSLKRKDERPKVIVYENKQKTKRKLLELKLIMVQSNDETEINFIPFFDNFHKNIFCRKSFKQLIFLRNLKQRL